MAVRFDADAEDFTRALGLGTVTAYTVTCWMYIAVDRVTWSTAWSIDVDGSDVDLVQTDSDGVTLNFYSDGDATSPGALTVGTWYFIGITRSGTGGTFYFRPEGAGSLTTTVIDGASNGATFTTLRLGESPFTGEWLNGRLAAVKIWNGATLTQTEVEAEAATYDVVRTTNIYGAYFRDAVALSQDYSGNGNHLSGGTNTSVEDGPAELDAGGGITEPYGHVSEAEAVRAFAATKATDFSPAAEVETARGLTAAKTTPVGRAHETELARTSTAAKATSVGRAAETETSRTLTAGKSAALDRATETESARTFTASKSTTVGRAVETETVTPFGATLDIIYGHAGETETVRAFVSVKAVELGRVAEVEAARSFAAALGYAYGHTAETEVARSFGTPQTDPFGHVGEVEVARGFGRPGTAVPGIIIGDGHRHIAGSVHGHQPAAVPGSVENLDVSGLVAAPQAAHIAGHAS